MISTITTALRLSRDVLRQVLNVALAAGQIIITLVGYRLGSNSNFTSTNATTPQIVPAEYVFSIWGLIYAGALAYAIYQALPLHREDELLRRIGFYTASAYLATCTWLLMAQLNLYGLTVVCIFWILGSLLGAFIQFIMYKAPLTRAQRFLVILPTSIYTGWATIAVIANIATALQSAGFSNVGLSNQNWTIVMLIVGTLIASFTTYRSRGNLGYALTLVWAFIGVVVANIVRTPGVPVAITAGIMAVALMAVLFIARANGRTAVSS
ncbi:MAG: tryptophan-rich sensory protein [Ktedonobacteraceae bacterium]